MPSTNSFSRADDAELVAACLRGDAAAWDALIDRYSALIYSIPLRLGLAPADAEDVFQNVCLLLLNHLNDVRDTARLAGWLAQATRREAWHVGRRRKRDLATADLADVAEPSGPDDQATEAVVLAMEEQSLVRRAVTALPDRCRRLLTLLYLGEPPLSYQDAAARMAMPLGSVGPVRARCLQRLEKILDEFGF